MGSGCIAPRILSTGNGWEWSVSCSGRFSPGKEPPRYPLYRRLDRLHTRSGHCCEEEKKSLPLAGIVAWSLHWPRYPTSWRNRVRVSYSMLGVTRKFRTALFSLLVPCSGSRSPLRKAKVHKDCRSQLKKKYRVQCLRGCIQKYPDWVDNERNNNKNRHPFRSNTKGYGGKTH
jgi:hypothetical protein